MNFTASVAGLSITYLCFETLNLHQLMDTIDSAHLTRVSEISMDLSIAIDAT